LPIASRAASAILLSLRPIAADIGDLVGDDEVVLGVDSGLHVVANQASPLGLRHH
jgi:hypothetical protein